MPSPGDKPRGGSPILIAFAGPERQRRVTVLFRAFMLIPHWIILAALGIAAGVVAVVGWFGALATGRLPGFAADFLSGYLRWTTRYAAYWTLLTDEYPPFSLDEADYPAQISLRPGRLNRLAVLFRLILLIPVGILTAVLAYGSNTIVLFVTWLIVLMNGRMPAALHEALAAVTRYLIRCHGYALMLTGTYPSGLFGDKPGTAGFTPVPGPEDAAGGYGAPGVPGAPAGTYGTYTPSAPAAPYGPTAGWPAADAPWEPGEPPAAAPGWPGQIFMPGPSPAAPYGPPAAPGIPPASGGPGGWPAAPGGWPPSAAARWPHAALPWRPILSSGAKWLVGCFIVLGMLFYAATIAFDTVSFSNASSAQNSAKQVQAAFAPLDKAVASFSTQDSACASSANPLHCLTATDRHLADSFATFGTKLRAIPMPSGPATTAASNLETATSQTEHAFRLLGSSRTPAQYQATTNSPKFTQTLNRFDQDYNALGAALGNAAKP